MSNLKIKKIKHQPLFPDETWIIHKNKFDQFQITLKQGKDIEIEYTWYGYNSRGSESMTIPVQLLKDLLSELGM